MTLMLENRRLEKAMHPREPGATFQIWAHIQVASGTRVACYHDEIKVSLPSMWTSQHHRFFTFFRIDLQTKLEAPKPDPKRKVHKPVKGVLRLEIEKLQAGNTDYENASETGSMTNDSVDHGDRLPDSRFTKWVSNGLHRPQSCYPRLNEGIEQPSNRSTVTGHVDVTTDDVQAFDFRTTTRNEPFLHLFHCLYVYPLTVNLSRKRNLFILVELRKDDTDARKQPLEAMHPREPGATFQKWAHTQVASGTRVACYHDEIKVSLPSMCTPQHHLFFTFFRIDLQTKLEAPKPSSYWICITSIIITCTAKIFHQCS